MVVLKEEAARGFEPRAGLTVKDPLESHEEVSCSAGRPGLCARWSLLLLHVGTVILAPYNFELDSWQVLGAAALHKDNVVLLQVVALPGDEAHGLLACAEPDAAALAVGRVGLLGLADECAQNHALQLRPALSGAQAKRRPLRRPQTVHLVQRSHGAGGPGLGYQGQATT